MGLYQHPNNPEGYSRHPTHQRFRAYQFGNHVLATLDRKAIALIPQDEVMRKTG